MVSLTTDSYRNLVCSHEALGPASDFKVYEEIVHDNVTNHVTVKSSIKFYSRKWIFRIHGYSWIIHLPCVRPLTISLGLLLFHNVMMKAGKAQCSTSAGSNSMQTETSILNFKIKLLQRNL